MDRYITQDRLEMARLDVNQTPLVDMSRILGQKRQNVRRALRRFWPRFFHEIGWEVETKDIEFTIICYRDELEDQISALMRRRRAITAAQANIAGRRK